MNIVVILALCFQAGEDEAAIEVPPISEEQISLMSVLILTTEARDVELKAQLEAEQRALTEAYEEFELDGEHIIAIQERIVATQKELLSNYHKLQAGYRKIVGKRSFPGIKKRVDYYVATAEERRKQQAAVDEQAEADKPAAEAGAAP